MKPLYHRIIESYNAETMHCSMSCYAHLCIVGKVGTLTLFLKSICENLAQKYFTKQAYKLEQFC